MCIGHIEGHGEGGSSEPVSEAMRCAGRRAGYHQAVFPRWRKRTQENIPRQESGATVTEIRALAVHTDDRLTR